MSEDASKHYRALVRFLATNPNERERLLQWMADTGVHPEDHGVWETVGAAFVGAKLGIETATAVARDGVREFTASVVEFVETANRLDGTIAQFVEAARTLEEPLELVERTSNYLMRIIKRD